MKYVCLVYLEPEKLHAVPDSECMTCGDRFRKSGLLVAAEALQPVDTATTVRVRNGKLSITDGPFGRDERAAGRLLPARSARPQRRHSDGREDSARARGQHRSAAGPGAESMMITPFPGRRQVEAGHGGADADGRARHRAPAAGMT